MKKRERQEETSSTRSSQQIARMNDDLDEIRTNTLSTIDLLLSRGEKLEALQQRGEVLADGSSLLFYAARETSGNSPSTIGHLAETVRRLVGTSLEIVGSSVSTFYVWILERPICVSYRNSPLEGLPKFHLHPERPPLGNRNHCGAGGLFMTEETFVCTHKR